MSNTITSASISEAYTTYTASSSSKGDSKKVTDTASSSSSAAESGVVYEKSSSSTSKKATYSINKMSADDRAALVEQLKADQQNRQNSLMSLAQDMLTKQGAAANISSLYSKENLQNVSQEEIEQAKKDVAEDGYYGVAQTSQRLFDFASALAGDDVDQMKKMQEAMQKGFELATQAWGTDLPSLCTDTMDAANKLFEDYYKSKEN